MNKFDNLSWLQNWYSQQCDDQWEEDKGIKIHTLDNPGWAITIDLKNTALEEKKMDMIKIEKSEDEWFHCWIKNNKFEAAGGPKNLSDIIFAFRMWAENE